MASRSPLPCYRSFFGAPAPPKRKAPAEDESPKVDAVAVIATPTKKPKRSPEKKQSKPRKEPESPVEPSSMEVDEKEAEVEKEAEDEVEVEIEKEDEEQQDTESDAAPLSPAAKNSPVKPKMGTCAENPSRAMSSTDCASVACM